MNFRTRLVATLRAVRPILEVPGVLVLGSEVPNLLQSNAASTLVVSQDVDIAVPVAAHATVKSKLPQLTGLKASADEPSVWVPDSGDLLEVNFIGMDPALSDPTESYVLPDSDLPLLVFGGLSLCRAGDPVAVDDLVIPVPRPAGLLLEKLLSDRTSDKGDRDLLVALGLLLVSNDADVEELAAIYQSLSPDLRFAVRSNVTILSLLARREGMPDPETNRHRVAALLARLEALEGAP